MLKNWKTIPLTNWKTIPYSWDLVYWLYVYSFALITLDICHVLTKEQIPMWHVIKSTTITRECASLWNFKRCDHCNNYYKPNSIGKVKAFQGCLFFSYLSTYNGYVILKCKFNAFLVFGLSSLLFSSSRLHFLIDLAGSRKQKWQPSVSMICFAMTHLIHWIFLHHDGSSASKPNIYCGH